MPDRYDAFLLVSFGGPEKAEDVIPFLQNVLRGRNVPEARMLEVAEHYYRFGGRSPLNDQNRQLMAAVEAELAAHGPSLPVYWGNRNWHPLLADTVRRMRSDGVKKAVAFVTSAFSSYSGCRQYREDIANARQVVGPGAPEIDKLRVFYNHPGFIAAITASARSALESIPAGRRNAAETIFTAHSIPLAMAQTSDYETQLREACRLVSAELHRDHWQLAYQSRSGPPQQAWLEPDIRDRLRELGAGGQARDVVIVPIGFVSDHMEVVFDLDTEAAELCARLGLNMVRAATPGLHPAFIGMIRDLILERMGQFERRFLGECGPRPDACGSDCCPPAHPSLSQTIQTDRSK